MSSLNASLSPIAVQHSDVLVLDALTRYVAQSGTQIGERLPPERVLAEQLGVSRNTVREALKRWEALGIIVRRKGSGTFLHAEVTSNDSFLSLRFKNDSQNMLHALEVRRIIEAESCGLAAIRASREDLLLIEQRLVEMERVHLSIGSAGAEDWAFHASIYQAAHNPLLLHMVVGLYDTLHAFFESPPEQALFSDSFPLHRTLFEAIARRDAIEATRVSHLILDITERDMKDVIHAARKI
ncbi:MULTISPECIES: FadR/GntR family transcriptional regulator [Erwinia]|uniref:GntR family transcriptional regulator n=1 Tax=Erwinia rhapontici TaxID=55212 RepID=A0ABM7N4X9_ERWRD|nr:MULTISPECIES: FadR/GntR family transcriptional regulator [Erwinia]MBP2152663.1 DNA-binding FadR family transcriptional regulator [Erwinia rhapontici]MCS3608010.1 DNA-binding FadR family transcriptional regulator [Erwinia rhapontici]NNS07940.1 FadR family transcriptional regulator [Erwinia sp. JH02]TDT00470.1 GntR family transcriptional regulator [Erwinia rhapontici]UDQ79613.1 FadR family transcriptional regulator [Erwinia rhapontici]